MFGNKWQGGRQKAKQTLFSHAVNKPSENSDAGLTELADLFAGTTLSLVSLNSADNGAVGFSLPLLNRADKGPDDFSLIPAC